MRIKMTSDAPMSRATFRLPFVVNQWPGLSLSGRASMRTGPVVASVSRGGRAVWSRGQRRDAPSLGSVSAGRLPAFGMHHPRRAGPVSLTSCRGGTRRRACSPCTWCAVARLGAVDVLQLRTLTFTLASERAPEHAAGTGQMTSADTVALPATNRPPAAGATDIDHGDAGASHWTA
jgi:hypothetical protein